MLHFRLINMGAGDGTADYIYIIITDLNRIIFGSSRTLTVAKSWTEHQVCPQVLSSILHTGDYFQKRNVLFLTNHLFNADDRVLSSRILPQNRVCVRFRFT